jgi:hypothetical protein
MSEIEITLPEDDWAALEELRIEFGYDTMDGFVNYILMKQLAKYDTKDDDGRK